MVTQRSTRPQELQPVSQRLSFLYVERATISRDLNTLALASEKGLIRVPVATLACLMLGPGTRISHQAVSVLSDSGVSVVWVGEQGVRYYAHGLAQARSTRLLERQAALVSNRRTRLATARRMYEMRFPGEDVSRLTMQQLRGREGARVRAAYRQEAARMGVEWSSRRYDPNDWAAGDPVNKALSAANACLYGICHAVVVALGCSPGLGFIHTGHARAFVYDVADLYKTSTSVPAAFEVVAEGEHDIGGRTRRVMRDLVRERHVLEQAVKDVTRLLAVAEDEDDLLYESLALWDEDEPVPAGVLYLDASELFDDLSET